MSLRPAPRTAWLGAATILVVAALVALGAVARGDFSDTDARILGTLAAVLYTGGALFAGLSVLERGHRGTGWAGSSRRRSASCSSSPLSGGLRERRRRRRRWAFSAMIALLVGLMLSTALLLARGDGSRRLALVTVSGRCRGLLSIAAIWRESVGDGWRSSSPRLDPDVLGYVLVPVVIPCPAAGSALRRADAGPRSATSSSSRPKRARSTRGSPGERLLLRRRTGPGSA